MKIVLKWSITCIGILCLVFFLGMYFGRRSYAMPPRQDDKSSVYNTEKATETTLVNINTANLETLQSLPGVGNLLAQRILAYRQEHGPFTNILQLKLVDGIGDGKMKELIPYICLEDAE